MKILQIIPFFAPAWGFGGPVKVCLQISADLVKNGHAVTVLTTDASSDGCRIERLSENIDGIKVKRFKNLLPGLTHGYNVFTPLGFKDYAKKELPKYSIVHCHSFFTYQNIVVSGLCQRYEIPYVLHLHESPVPLKILGKQLIKQIFNFLYGRKILAGASKIVVVSEREKQLLSNYLPQAADKISIVPNAIDIQSNISPVSSIQKETKKILCLSRLSFIKGIDSLIRAFGRLAGRDPSYRLTIAGPDENNTLKKLKNLCQELKIEQYVSFIGLVEGKKKEDLFIQADVFALFSLYESFSIATLEAIQHGLPCCLSKEVGIAKQVSDGKCGVIVQDLFDAEEGADQLEFCYNNRITLSQNYLPFLENFSYEKIDDMILKIYKEALS